MRRIVVSVNVSLDGFAAGTDGELDWHLDYWTAGMAERLCLQLSQADTILLGRKTYKAMADYWPNISNNLCYPRGDLAFAEMMNDYEKVVVSRTLKKPKWHNSTLLNGKLLDSLPDLKTREGRDIMVLGSLTLTRYLLKNRLVDELFIWLHPVVLGKGEALFDNYLQTMVLKGITQFSSGVVMLNYSLS